jgi:hypothetical protein
VTSFTPDPSSPPSRFARAATALLLAAGAAHLLQLASPIRVNTDALRLLNMAWGKATTGVLPPEQFPPVYPSTIALLVRAGLDAPVLLTLFNYAALAIGLFAWASVASRSANWSANALRLGALLFLCSWVVVKHAPIPLTEPLYFGLTGIALFAVVRARDAVGSSALAWWLASFATAALATLTRTIGVALLAAIALSATLHFAPALRQRAFGQLQRLSPRALKLLLAVGALLCTALLVVVTRAQLGHPDSYFNNWIAITRRSSLADLLALWSSRLAELGALTINLPLHPHGSAGLFTRIVGTALAAALLLQLWRHRRRFGAINAYVLFYGAILATWPYEDPRFWLPLLPWMLLVIAPAAPCWPTNPRALFAARVAFGLYIAFGFVALGHSTRLTFAGDAFPARYTHGILRASYEIAWGKTTTPAEPPDPLATTILRRYAPDTPLPDARR